MYSEWLKRFNEYQKERFPVLKYAVLVFILTFSTMCFGQLIQGTKSFPGIIKVIVTFLIIYIFFMQLRIADEFKDYDEDMKYRPYRPVPRGLVSLKELRSIGVINFFIQLLLVIFFEQHLIWIFFSVYIYFFLMSKEFFISEWLNRHQVIYMFSHMVIMIFFHLLIIMSVFEKALQRETLYVSLFLLMGFLTGMLTEIGRKIRNPKDEENGVNTYSKIMGLKKAVFIFIFIEFLVLIVSLVTAIKINFLLPLAVATGLVFLVSLYTAVTFLKKPGNGEVFEKLSGIYVAVVYFMLGIMPLLVKGG